MAIGAPANSGLAASLILTTYGDRWAILPEAFEELTDTVRRANITDLAQFAAQAAAAPSTLPVAMSSAGVATIPIYGPIVPRATLFSRIFGLTSADTIAASFGAAVRDPNVRGIVLDVDSPGGALSGIPDLAAMIYAARGKKPIKAFIEGTAGSGAYWLASAADEVVASVGSLGGSVGVVVQVQRGDRNMIEIVSSQSPNKRPDAFTDAGRAEIQKVVDALADVFIEAVATHRRMCPGEVVERFNHGGMLVGKGMVAAGMADRIGTFESVVESIRGPAGAGASARTAATPYGYSAAAGAGAEVAALTAKAGPATSEEALRARWMAEGGLRQEFPSFESFAAFERASAAGRVTIVRDRAITRKPGDARSL